ncbi:hypothetical protein EIN_060150 [Entamoeba invadens IP1]|uniref:hypothetical protein n=1 Tax=Entamoeba invadens IP1 TaxID=370355 RepID=UPI0002C3E8AB|nr:hypothetical protein EIN_060150 [Entamoeba invadens IP1]ELP93500.1 hypothetical protein EIN_060150 [Entamoeba invadens IP1]|eukprot:XP_004260271.1 hypothetical protein EIN_060150 [Entamoeba invadens IP1]
MEFRNSIFRLAEGDTEFLKVLSREANLTQSLRRDLWKTVLSDVDAKNEDTEKSGPKEVKEVFGKITNATQKENFGRLYLIVEQLISTEDPQFEATLVIATLIAPLFEDDLTLQKKAITWFLQKNCMFQADLEGIVQLLHILIYYHNPVLAQHITEMNVDLYDLILPSFFTLLANFFVSPSDALALYDKLLFTTQPLTLFLMASIMLINQEVLVSTNSALSFQACFSQFTLTVESIPFLFLHASYLQNKTPSSFTRLLNSCLTNGAVFQRWAASGFDGGLSFPVSPIDVLADKTNGLKIEYVDARSDSDYSNGHISNALQLKDVTLSDTHYVLYFSGASNETETIKRTIQNLHESGIKRVSLLGGGYSLYHKFWTERSEGFAIDNHTKECAVCKGLSVKTLFDFSPAKKDIQKRKLRSSISDRLKEKIVELVGEKSTKELPFKSDDPMNYIPFKRDIYYEGNVCVLEYNSIELTINFGEQVLEEILYNEIDHFCITGKSISIFIKNTPKVVKVTCVDDATEVAQDLQKRAME